MKMKRQQNRSGMGGMVVAAMVGLLPLAHARLSHAQVMVSARASSDGPGEAPISKKSLERYAEVLGLDATQKEDAAALYEGYAAQHRTASEAMRRGMREASSEFSDSQDFQEFQKLMKKTMDAYRLEGERLEKEFFGDLRQVISSEQDERWDRIERLRRREKGLRFGSLSGERIDLTDVLRGMKVDASKVEGLDDALLQYEIDLDRALVERAKVMEAMAAGDQGEGIISIPDPAVMQERMEKMREAGAKIRDVNERHTRVIQAMLGEGESARLTEEVRRRSFPQVYRRTHAQRVLDAAAGMADLSSDQKRRLEEVREAYEREARGVNDRWIDAIAKSEEEGGDGAFMLGGGQVLRMSMGGDDSGPVADARKARRDTDKKLRERVESLLTPEQRAKLPEPGVEREEMMLEDGASFVTESVIIQR